MRTFSLVVLLSLVAVAFADPVPKKLPPKTTCGDIQKREAAVKQREDAVGKREADVAQRELVVARKEKEDAERLQREREELTKKLK